MIARKCKCALIVIAISVCVFRRFLKNVDLTPLSSIKAESDNPTIGMILCSEKNETIVKYSVLNENKQMFASRYKLYLPTEEELAKELRREMELIRGEDRLR